MKSHLNDEDRISLCLDIATSMLEFDKYTTDTVLQYNGDEEYTEATQLRFNAYYDEAESILFSNNLIE
jgi:hypothetical protein